MSDSNIEWLNNPTGKIPKGKLCGECGRYNARNVCSHALVVKDKKVLLIKRATDPMKGWWAIPAGYLDWDESMEECAVRELWEEAGVRGQNPQLFGVYSSPTRDEDGRQNVAVIYEVEVVSEDDASLQGRTPEEVEEVRWFGLGELPENIAFDHRKIIEDYQRSSNVAT